MKKIIHFAFFVIVLSSCGNARGLQDAQAADGMQAAVETTSSEVAQENAADRFALTDTGVGPIVLGMKVSEIPSSVAGLYDRVEKVETPDAEEYHFFSGETALFSAEDTGDGIVSGISLWNESGLKVATSNGEDYISM